MRISRYLLEELIEFSEIASGKYGLHINGGIKLKGKQTEDNFCSIEEFKKIFDNSKNKVNEIEYVYLLLFKPKNETKIYYAPLNTFSGDGLSFRKKILEKKYLPEKIYVTQTKMEISQGARKLLKSLYPKLRKVTTLDRWS